MLDPLLAFNRCMDTHMGADTTTRAVVMAAARIEPRQCAIWWIVAIAIICYHFYYLLPEDLRATCSGSHPMDNTFLSVA